jgi:hypothetical protein
MLGKFFLQFKNILFLWVFCLSINIITFLFIFIKINPRGNSVALFYNVLAGVEWYGKGTNLYFIPLSGLLMLFVNLALYKTLKNIKVVMPFLAVFVTLFIQVIILIAALSLSTVN